jgi:transposase
VESQAARIARLEEQVRSLEADKVKLSKEREILQSAAKYFAGETNW